MRIPINLASEPFRSDRPLIVASAGVGALLVVLLIALISLAVREHDAAAESREAIAQIQRQMRTVSMEQTKLQGVLRRPENAEVLEQSIFLNELLARKGVSWTKIFSDLEQVMPANVRLVQVRPQINGQNQLMLDMTIAAQSTEPVINFLMKLEGSSLFGATTLQTSLPPSLNEPLYRFRLNVSYAQKL